MALELISYEVVVREGGKLVERIEKASRSDAIELARAVNANIDHDYRAEVYQLTRRAIHV